MEDLAARSLTHVLLDGVSVHPLATFPDRRGTFTEVFRNEWDVGVRPCQWDSIVTNRGGVVRGMKVHLHNDHFVVLQLGRATFGLKDIRPGSPTDRLTTTLELDAANQIVGVTIPRGVAHGFYLSEPSVILIGDTSYYDQRDQLRCYWADPELGIPWPADDAIISDEDAAGLSFAKFAAVVARERRA